MSEPAKTPPKPAVKFADRKVFKYPSEEETFVRRLGSAVLSCWSTLPPETREKLLAEAVNAWDREYNIAQLPQKLDTFVKRYPGRLG